MTFIFPGPVPGVRPCPDCGRPIFKEDDGPCQMGLSDSIAMAMAFDKGRRDK